MVVMSDASTTVMSAVSDQIQVHDDSLQLARTTVLMAACDSTQGRYKSSLPAAMAAVCDSNQDP
jgi:hypothetical protein